MVLRLDCILKEKKIIDLTRQIIIAKKKLHKLHITHMHKHNIKLHMMLSPWFFKMKDSSDISVHYSPFESSTFTFTNNQFKRQVETNLGDPEEVSEVEKTNVEEKETENYKNGSEGSLRKPKSPKQQGPRRKKHQKRQNSKRPQPNEHQFGTFERPTFEFESLKAYTAYD